MDLGCIHQRADKSLADNRRHHNHISGAGMGEGESGRSRDKPDKADRDRLPALKVPETAGWRSHNTARRLGGPQRDRGGRDRTDPSKPDHVHVSMLLKM